MDDPALPSSASPASEPPLASETLLEGKRFRVVRKTYPGRDGRPVVKEVIEHPGAVVVLPVFDDGAVCLIRNFRPSIGRELLELPAGTREPAEAPEITAVRELEEETGYRASQWEKLAEFYASPGVINERMFLFRAAGLTPGDQNLMEDERIVNRIVSPAEIRTLLSSGGIEDAKTFIGLTLHLARLDAGK